MPEKDIAKEIWILIIIVPFLATVAKSLNSFFSPDYFFSWKEFMIQSFVGTVSGMLFGLLACWLVSDSQAAIGAISGFGAVLGIASIAKIAKKLEELILKKLS
jgi:Mg/Co/Ni transporter MgtE